MLKPDRASHLQSLSMHETYQFRITGISYLDLFGLWDQ